jgi:Fur family ferric uptake transcriptional regulator
MMDKNLKKEAKRLLKVGCLNRTKAQTLIMEQLLKANRPLSGEELAEQLGCNGPDKATIYRIIERFCSRNLVHKAYVKDRAAKYELAHNCTAKQCHPHFTCTNCGKTFCLKGRFVPLIKGLKEGFIVHRQQVRIEGLCSSCS